MNRRVRTHQQSEWAIARFNNDIDQILGDGNIGDGERPVDQHPINVSRCLNDFAGDFPKSALNDYTDSIAEALDRWYELSSAIMHHFDGVSLSNILYTHSKLQHWPDRDWLADWYGCCQEKMAEADPTFTSRHFSNCIYAHGLLALSPDSVWLDEWQRQVLEEGRLREFDSQGFANSLYALAMLYVIGNEVCRPIASSMLAQATQMQRPELRRHHLQIASACKALELERPDYIDDSLIQSRLEKDIDEELLGLHEEKIAKALEQAGFQLSENRFCDYTQSLFDQIATKSFPNADQSAMEQHCFYIQVDGSSHDVYLPDGSTQLDGPTRLQNFLFEQATKDKLTEHLIRLSHDEIEAELDNLKGLVIRKASEAMRPKPCAAVSATSVGIAEPARVEAADSRPDRTRRSA